MSHSTIHGFKREFLSCPLKKIWDIEYESNIASETFELHLKGLVTYIWATHTAS